MVAGIAVTCSRGGWAVAPAVLVLFCVVLLTQRDYRLHGLLLAVVLAAAGTAVMTKVQLAQRMLSDTTQGSVPNDMRLSIWHAAFGIWQDNFWLGAGPAHFDYRFRQYRPARIQRGSEPRAQRLPEHAGGLGGDGGSAGGFGVGVVWHWGVGRSWKHVQGARDDFARKRSNKFALTVGASVGLAAILLHSAVDFNLHIPAIAILVVTLMALLSSQLRFATERYWFNLRVVRKRVATVVLVAGVSVLSYAGWRAAREDYYLGQAARMTDYSRGQQQALERAFAVEPKNPDTAWRIGECCRTRSFLNQTPDPDALAREAMEWYRRGIKLNPYDPYNWAGCGMCLDWINAGDEASKAEAAADYQRADALDPNGCTTATLIGRHYEQTGDLAAARTWFERSVRLAWESNDLPVQYLSQLRTLMDESAAKNGPAEGAAERSGGLRNRLQNKRDI